MHNIVLTIVLSLLLLLAACWLTLTGPEDWLDLERTDWTLRGLTGPWGRLTDWLDLEDDWLTDWTLRTDGKTERAGDELDGSNDGRPGWLDLPWGLWNWPLEKNGWTDWAGSSYNCMLLDVSMLQLGVHPSFIDRLWELIPTYRVGLCVWIDLHKP